MNAFKRNLLIGYGLSLALLVASTALSYNSIINLLRSAALVNHTHEVLKKLDDVIAVVKDAETGQRGFLLTGNEAFLDRYHGVTDKATLLINDVKQLTADNPQQQVASDSLHQVVLTRLAFLTTLVEEKKRAGIISDSLLLIGKGLMDQTRQLVNGMQARESALLQTRTATMSRFATATPAFIVVASLLAIIITLISFFRINADFEKRQKLQSEVERKNEAITRRIGIIERITARIAEGDYATRVSEADRETLGVLAPSLDKMAAALEESFNTLAAREWQQTGIAQLNERMLGEKDLNALTSKAIEFLTSYTTSAVGAFYLVTSNRTLHLASSIALNRSQARAELPFGEGLAGQSAQSHQPVLLQDVDEAEVLIDYAAGSLKPKSIIAVPVLYETRLKGVIELASLHACTPEIQEFLKSACFNIGTAIHSARDHQRLQELLGETQAQSEELQAQHSELENINAELQAQAEKLQASEEELRVQQEELQQANQELEERSRLLEEKNELILERNLDIQRKAEDLALSTKYKSEFLANMSHELRTPLNSILLLSRLLSENHTHNLSQEQIEYANVIQSSGKGLLTLIDEILDLSKIEAGKMELEYSNVNIAAVANDLYALMSPLAKEKGIGFTVDIAPDAPEVLETDRLRLEQILRNLLSNALKFTKRGSVMLQINKTDSNLAFAVKDSGIGIPEEKQQTIFEAFQQADGSTRRQYGGTGLGLSISRELAKLLGGEIRLQSQEGKGSTFTLVLPIKKGQTLAAVDVTAPAMQAVAAPAPVSSGTATNEVASHVGEIIPAALPDDREGLTKEDKVLLIIEDDTAFARSLLDYTRRNGYKGLVAVRGDEGIALAKRFKPLGILLDIQLPVKNGWEVMDALKADPQTRAIPVHMMSAHGAKRESLSKGAVDFIDKPVAFEKLGTVFQKIEQALRRHPKKVLIVEENAKHAKALAYFLETYNVAAEIQSTVDESIQALHKDEVDCVILDMGTPGQQSYDVLEGVKKTPGLEQLPIIVFTGKTISHAEEKRVRQYADSIVVKTAQSFQRILDEVSLFLHLVEQNQQEAKTPKYKRLGGLGEVLKGKTVLIADDDVRNIFSLTKSLENYGVQVVSAMDGKDALRQLEEAGPVDLVLMDMMMPEMDGYESTKRIRELPKYRNLPIIAVTAKAMTGDREKCIAAGASDYITKPVDVDQLISLLRVWLYE